MASIEDNLADLHRRQLEAADRALGLAADHLLAEAVQQAPLETGELRASGKVDREENPDGGVTYFVAFTTPYAAVQHERKDYVHPIAGNAKYLENPLKANMYRYEAALAKSVDDAART